MHNITDDLLIKYKSLIDTSYASVQELKNAKLNYIYNETNHFNKSNDILSISHNTEDTAQTPDPVITLDLSEKSKSNDHLCKNNHYNDLMNSNLNTYQRNSSNDVPCTESNYINTKKNFYSAWLQYHKYCSPYSCLTALSNINHGFSDISINSMFSLGSISIENNNSICRFIIDRLSHNGNLREVLNLFSKSSKVDINIIQYMKPHYTVRCIISAYINIIDAFLVRLTAIEVPPTGWNSDVIKECNSNPELRYDTAAFRKELDQIDQHTDGDPMYWPCIRLQYQKYIKHIDIEYPEELLCIRSNIINRNSDSNFIWGILPAFTINENEYDSLLLNFQPNGNLNPNTHANPTQGFNSPTHTNYENTTIPMGILSRCLIAKASDVLLFIKYFGKKYITYNNSKENAKTQCLSNENLMSYGIRILDYLGIGLLLSLNSNDAKKFRKCHNEFNILLGIFPYIRSLCIETSHKMNNTDKNISLRSVTDNDISNRTRTYGIFHQILSIPRFSDLASRPIRRQIFGLPSILYENQSIDSSLISFYPLVSLRSKLDEKNIKLNFFDESDSVFDTMISKFKNIALIFFESCLPLESDDLPLYKYLYDKYRKKWSCELLVTAVSFLKKGHFRDSITYCNAALSHDSECVDAYIIRGASKANTGNYDEALDDFGLALKIDPMNINAMNYKDKTLEQKLSIS